LTTTNVGLAHACPISATVPTLCTWQVGRRGQWSYVVHLGIVTEDPQNEDTWFWHTNIPFHCHHDALSPQVLPWCQGGWIPAAQTRTLGTLRSDRLRAEQLSCWWETHGHRWRPSLDHVPGSWEHHWSARRVCEYMCLVNHVYRPTYIFT